MLPARRNKWLAVLLVLMCHELVIAQDGGTDEHSADTSPQTPSQRILAAFPGSAQVTGRGSTDHGSRTSDGELTAGAVAPRFDRHPDLSVRRNRPP